MDSIFFENPHERKALMGIHDKKFLNPGSEASWVKQFFSVERVKCV
jgi:hypothetical protein